MREAVFLHRAVLEGPRVGVATAGGHLQQLLLAVDEAAGVRVRRRGRSFIHHVLRAGGSVGGRRHVHVDGGRLVEAVHVALHLIQQPLLLSFGDASKTHS